MYCKVFRQYTSQNKNFNFLFFLVINILESHYNEIEKTIFKKWNEDKKYKKVIKAFLLASPLLFIAWRLIEKLFYPEYHIQSPQK